MAAYHPLLPGTGFNRPAGGIQPESCGMSQPDTPQSQATETSPANEPATKRAHAIKKAAARATAASMKLENREAPIGHVRSDGVSALLTERQPASTDTFGRKISPHQPPHTSLARRATLHLTAPPTDHESRWHRASRQLQALPPSDWGAKPALGTNRID